MFSTNEESTQPLAIDIKTKSAKLKKFFSSNELTYKTERNSQKTNLRLLGEGIVRVFGKVMYTLLYSKLIISKDLLYSIWSST